MPVGWEPRVSPDDQYGGYTTFHKNGRKVAGLGGAMGGSEAPDAWMTICSSKTRSRPRRRSSQPVDRVFAPTATVGDQGRLAVAADPGGATVGLWQPGEHRGYELAAEVARSSGTS